MVAFGANEEKDHPGLFTLGLILVENGTDGRKRHCWKLVLVKYTGKRTHRFHSEGKRYWSEPIPYRCVRGLILVYKTLTSVASSASPWVIPTFSLQKS